jgi:hypothetical protein
VCDGDDDCGDGSDEDTGPGGVCGKVVFQLNYFVTIMPSSRMSVIMNIINVDDVRTLIIGTEMVPEMLAVFNLLTWLIAQEDFININKRAFTFFLVFFQFHSFYVFILRKCQHFQSHP